VHRSLGGPSRFWVAGSEGAVQFFARPSLLWSSKRSEESNQRCAIGLVEREKAVAHDLRFASVRKDCIA
jgi:hypothetical protein